MIGIILVSLTSKCFCIQQVLALKRSVHGKTAGELIDVDAAEERAAEIVPGVLLY